MNRAFTLALTLLLLTLAGCSGGSSGPSASAAPTTSFLTSEPTQQTSARAALRLYFETPTSSIVRSRLSPEARIYRVEVYSSEGVLVHESETAPVDQRTIEHLPAGRSLVRTLYRDSAGTNLGYLDRFLTLETNRTHVLELRAFIAGAPPAVPSSFPSVGGSPAQLVFLEVPGSLRRGQNFEVKLALLDALGAPVVYQGGSVTVTTEQAQISGNSTATFADGEAALTLSISGPAEAVRLTAQADVGSRLTAQSLLLSIPALEPPNRNVPARLRFLGSPTDGPALQPLAPLQVEVLDIYGQRVSGSGLSVTLSLGANPLPPDDAVLSGGLTATSVAGLASFPQVTIDKAGRYRLLATAPDVIATAGEVFTLTAPVAPEPLPGRGHFAGLLGLPVRPADFYQTIMLHDVTSGDFDGDGYRDLITVHQEIPPQGLVFHAGDGRGAFAAPVASASGVGLIKAETADLDGDGDLDLVGVSYSNSSVRLYSNSGSGNFSSLGVALTTGSGPTDLCLADFNRDGRTDIATANRDAGSVTVFLNSGGTSYAPGVSVAVAGGPVALVPGDIDADGDTDLVTANVFDGSATIVRNDGGTWVPLGSLPMGAGTHDIAVGDLNGDGRLDLASANRDADAVSIRLATAGGGFGNAITVPVDAGPRSIALADLQGDGRLDIVVSNFAAATATVLLSEAEGWSSPTHWPVGLGPLKMVLEDFTSDGRPDLVVGNLEETSVLIRENLGDGTFLLPDSEPILGGSGTILSGNLNNDGRPDFLFPSDLAIGTYGLLLSNGRTGYVASTERVELPYYFFDPKLFDLDGDGDLDLIDVQIGQNTVVTYINNGAGKFGPGRVVTNITRPYSYALGDLNGDGHPDLVAASSLPQDLLVHLGDGQGSFLPAPVATYPGGGGEGLILADFSGDGRLDLVFQSDSNNRISLRLGLGDGTFASPIDLGPFGYRFTAGDLDQDGDEDLVAINGYSVNLFFNTGSGNFNNPVTYSAPARLIGVELADMDSDGVLDVVLDNSDRYGRTIPLSSSVTIGVNDGNGSLANFRTYRKPPDSYNSAKVDFDGDGDLDIVSVGRDQNLMEILENRP